MKTSLQIQSILYCNENKESIVRTLLSVSNAVRVAQQFYDLALDVSFIYGDASPEPVFSAEEITDLQRRLSDAFSFGYRFFNENTGSARGHNLLSGETESAYIMIMNPDVKLAPDIFHHLLQPFADDSVGMVEARQTPIEHAKEYDLKTLETKWASTACVVVPRRIFEELNGFDADSFFLYCDDVDFSWRVRLKGYKVLYQPLAMAYHDKELSERGKWQPTKTEVYYSSLAGLMLPYKWSNNRLCKAVLRAFSDSPNPYEQKAAAEFKRLKAEGKLPEQLDSGHKVAVFVNGNYCKHRFVMPAESCD